MAEIRFKAFLSFSFAPEDEEFIALATRRTKVEGSELWTCPDWIQHENALANAYEKPSAIFYEDNVRLDGLIAVEERRERELCGIC